ncbi:MAG: hypothetical protein ACLQJR_11555 [Stellaceae bacterium]
MLLKIAVFAALLVAFMLVASEQGVGSPFRVSAAGSAATESSTSTWLVDDNDRDGRGDARDQVKAKRPSQGDIDKRDTYRKSPFSAKEAPGGGEIVKPDPDRGPTVSDRPIDVATPGGAQHTPER